MRPAHYHSNSKGSALVFTLVLTGIMLLILGAMLSSVSYMARSANDKISQEEAYHMALSGINVAKSWVFDPALAEQHTGSSAVSDAMETIRNDAVDYTTAIGNAVRGAPPGTIVVNPVDALNPTNFFDGAVLMDDGRYLIYEHSASDSNKAVYFRRDVETSPTEDLFHGPEDQLHASVERFRITSPYPTDNLRIVKLILEAEGAVYGAGKPKRRILQQKINVIPQADSDEAGNGFSIVAAGGVSLQGQSHLGVRWGSVFGTGHLNILAAQQLSDGDADPYVITNITEEGQSYNFTWEVDNTKFVAAGVDTTQDPNGTTVPFPMDKWVKYQTAGQIYTKYQANQGTFEPLFPTAIRVPPDNHVLLNGVDMAGKDMLVTDFFTQLQRGDWYSPSTGQAPSVTLQGYALNYATAGGIMWSARAEQTADDPPVTLDPYNAELTQRGWQMGTGAFVQGSELVTPWINNFINTNYWSDSAASLNDNVPYQQWKERALTDGYFLKRTSSRDYFNDQGFKLYLDNGNNLTTVASGNTELRDNNLNRIDVWEQVVDGDTSVIPDKVLMIDAPGQTIGLPGDFFWKGLIYINGNFDDSGTPAGNVIRVKSPDQWNGVTVDPITGAAIPPYYTVGRAFLDGVLFTTGDITRSGNNVLYGSIVSKGSVRNTSGDPEILYNSRLKIGLFQNPLDPIGNGSEMISGPISEVNGWAGTSS